MKRGLFLIIVYNFLLNVSGQTWNKVGGGISGSPGLEVIEGKLNTGSATLPLGDPPYFMAIWDGQAYDDSTMPFPDLDGGQVFSIKEFKGNLYLGGSFSKWNSNFKKIIGWDGIQYFSLGSGGPFAVGDVNCMMVFQDELYVAGSFSTMDSTNYNKIAKWNGTSWSDVGGGITCNANKIEAMVVYKGELYVAGTFNCAGGNISYNIARWNGSEWNDVGIGVDGPIQALIVDTLKDVLYASGGITWAGGVNVWGIAQWDGTSWANIGSGGITGGGTAMAIYHNELYITGYASTGSEPDTVLAKWDGVSWEKVFGPNGYAYSMVVFKDELYLLGEFTKVNGDTSLKYFARYHTPTPPITKPGEVIGDSVVCTGENGVVYQTPYIENATSYAWTIPPGFFIINGANTYRIIVNIADSATSGFITVRGINSVGDGPVSDSFAVNVNIPPVVVFDTNAIVCRNEVSFNLTGGSPAGGMYSGNGISGNIFDPEISGVGNHNISYSYSDSNGCTNTDTAFITVNSLPEITLDSLPSYCENSTPFQLTGGLPNGGIYYGSGISGDTLNPAIAGVGTHIILYEYTDSNGCTNSMATSDITINPKPVITLDTLTAFCENSNSIVLTNGLPIGGTYSGTGVSGNNFDPATAGVGNHNLIYEFTDSNGCTNTPASAIIIVYPNPSLTLTIPDTVCKTTGAFALAATPTGGIFSGNGVSGNMFNPSLVNNGTHTIQYSFTDSNNCTSTETTQIYVDVCTGVSPLSIIHYPLSIIPNPNSGIFTLNCTPNSKLEIYNSTGILVYYQSINSAKTDLNLGSLRNGIYLFRVVNEFGGAVSRVVVEK